MMERETPGSLVLREAREKRITDYYKCGDGRNMDAELDVYPYGNIRPNISEERAKEIANGLTNLIQLREAA